MGRVRGGFLKRGARGERERGCMFHYDAVAGLTLDQLVFKTTGFILLPVDCQAS